MNARPVGTKLVSLLAALLSASALAQTAPSLGQAGSFAALGSTDVNNTGPSRLFGDLGVSPGSVIVGFPPGQVIGGATHQTDAVAAQARADTTSAYLNLAGQPSTADLSGIDLGGQNLVAGVYRFTSSAQITGTLTLNAQGNANAVFIFQIGSTLTAASGSTVQVINGGSPCNVFWQVGSSATLNTTAAFKGNILALTDASLRTGANVVGRVLVRNGQVTLDDNDITSCSAVCAAISVAPTTLPDAAQNAAYSQALSASGGAGPYTFRVTSGALPAGLSLGTNGVLSGSSSVFGTFNFTVTASDSTGCTGGQPYSLIVMSDGSTTGDPHMHTIDGLAYEFQSCGEFMLLRTAGSGLEVQVQQTPWVNSGTTVNTAVAMRVAGHTVLLAPFARGCDRRDDAAGGCVQVDGQPVSFACVDDAPGCLLSQLIPGVGRLEHRITGVSGEPQFKQQSAAARCNEDYRLELLTGERVTTCVSGGYLNVHTMLPPAELGRTIGLLGNGDGDPTNDLATGGGQFLPLNVGFDEFNARFSDHWRVSASQSLFGDVTAPAHCANHQFRFADLSPELREHALITCRSMGVSVGNLDACAMDVAVLGDDAVLAFVGMADPRAVVTHPLPAGITSSVLITPVQALVTQGASLPSDELELSPNDALQGAATGCGCGSTDSAPMVFGFGLLGLVMLATRRRRAHSNGSSGY